MPLQLDILQDIGEIMGSSLELKQAFDRVMRVLVAQVGIERGRLVIMDDATGELRTEAAHGLTQEMQRRGKYAIGEGITGQVYQTGQARIIPDVRVDPEFLDRTADLKERGEQFSFFCLPITSDGRTIGVLSVDKRYVDEETLNSDGRLLTIVTALIAQAVRLNRMIHREKQELIDELAEHRKTIHERYQFANIIGSSAPMIDVFRTVDQVARTRATVLLMGETGTGKELIAKAIHYNSDRRDKPFVRMNCGALSGELLESELFGHVRGAFTGAIADKVGRFGAANGGTVFLDEVTTMTMSLQVKLLRVLQEREFERVGDLRTVATDVRVIAATNVDLEEEVKGRRFREDLYYRLNVVAIHLPPLRERREDIPLLIDHFLDKYNAQNGKSLRKISRELLGVLLRYPWPGNVRELENAIERAVVLSQDEYFTTDLLPLSIRAFAMEQDRLPVGGADSSDDLIKRVVGEVMDQTEPDGGKSVWDLVTHRVERILIEKAMERCGGVKLKAADFLGINRNTLNKKYNDLAVFPGQQKGETEETHSSEDRA